MITSVTICMTPMIPAVKMKRVAADHYVYALVDYTEVDRRPALRRLFA